MLDLGITFSAQKFDMNDLRRKSDRTLADLAGGVQAIARQDKDKDKDKALQGTAGPVAPVTVKVDGSAL
jgi:hypothetical protein